MEPDIKKAEEEARKIREKYNPEAVSPFPHQKIIDAEINLNISFLNMEEDNVSGAILFNKQDNSFKIFINSLKPKMRQHYTLAHELGHFFLHKDVVEEEESIIDGEKSFDGTKILFLLDEEKRTNIEIEASCFASNLIMPKELVVEAWEKLGKIEDCANIFNVSVVTMAGRLARLGLIEEE